jgi:hypothetical protein
VRRQGKKLAQVARVQARGQLYIPEPGTPDEPEAAVDEALAVFGLVRDQSDAEDVPEEKCYLWPCNVPTFNLWKAVQTQWRRAGMVGAKTGLDYDAVIAYMRDVLGIKRKDRAELFAGIKAMEVAAINTWAEQQD